MKVRKFIEVDSNWGISLVDPFFKQAYKGRVANHYGFYHLASFENPFVITYMTMQDGTIDWVVIYRPVDSKIEIRNGSFNSRIEVKHETEVGGIEGRMVLEHAINHALTELTSKWMAYQK